MNAVLNRPIIQHILRIFLALVFLASALVKLLSIDSVELYIFRNGFFNLPVSAVLTRLLIGVEASLGFLLAIQFRLRTIRWSAIGLIGLFSVFLLYRMSLGDTENCMCFGMLIEMSPAESLLKNAGLLFLLVLLKPVSTFQMRHVGEIALFSVALSSALPMLVSPPDIFTTYAEMPAETMQEASLRIQQNKSMQESGAGQGRKLICFFSTSCDYCVRAAGKISVIAQRAELREEVLYVFTGDTDLADFWKESGSEKFSYIHLPMKEFFSLAGASVPSIYLVENGAVQQHFHYRSISEELVLSFFSKD